VRIAHLRDSSQRGRGRTRARPRVPKLVIDTTGVSPTILGDPVYSCTYPNQAARADATAACFQEPVNLRPQCFQQIEIDFPNIKQCATQRPPRHSYIDFGTAAEAYGAVDVPFDDLTTIERDTWGPGGVRIDINNVHTQINNSTFFATFSRGLSGRATADLWLTLYGNSPTLPCVATSSLVGCPDVELTNMKVNVALSGIGPSAYDNTRLGFDQILSTFYFDRNLNGVPDWMVTAFVDIDKIIHDIVEHNIERALGSTAGRIALEKALTALAVHKVKPDPNAMGGGIKRFYRGWYESGALMVDYEPEPPPQMQ